MGTWRGTTAVKLQPTYPRFKRTAKGATLILVFRGPYTALRTYGPAIGDDIVLGAFGYEGEAEIVYANQVECQPDGGGESGPGTLTVVYTNEPEAGYNLIANQTIVEVDWTSLEKRLETHPDFAAGGAFELDDSDWQAIAKWRADQTGENYSALSLFAKVFADKVKKGVEGYIAPAPIVRKTTRHTSAPTTASVGTVTTGSPASGAPSGYQWLKTGDRGIRQAPASGWERVEEWTGAKVWDPQIYGSVI